MRGKRGRRRSRGCNGCDCYINCNIGVRWRRRKRGRGCRNNAYVSAVLILKNSWDKVMWFEMDVFRRDSE